MPQRMIEAALKGLRDSPHRDCPACGYWVSRFHRTCQVCGHECGRDW
jgi:ribosomal protein L32